MHIFVQNLISASTLHVVSLPPWTRYEKNEKKYLKKYLKNLNFFLLNITLINKVWGVWMSWTDGQPYGGRIIEIQLNTYLVPFMKKCVQNNQINTWLLLLLQIKKQTKNKWIVNYAMRNIHVRPRRKCRSVVISE